MYKAFIYSTIDKIANGFGFGFGMAIAFRITKYNTPEKKIHIDKS